MFGRLGHHHGFIAPAQQFLLRQVFGVAAQDDIGAASGHVGGDGDHPQPARLGDDPRLLLVELGVQDLVRNTPTLQYAA